MTGIISGGLPIVTASSGPSGTELKDLAMMRRVIVLWRFLFCGFTNGIDTKVYGPVAGSLCGQHSFQDTKNSSS